MRLFFLGLLASTILHPCLALRRGYNYGFETSPMFKRQQDGAGTDNSTKASASRDPSMFLGSNMAVEVLPRQEIRVLQEDGDQWTLYLLALSAMQWMDQTDPLSYYQLAGIHAVPWHTYNDIEQDSDLRFSGFCHHNSVLFPTWHRAYLAMYEKVVLRQARRIAKLYTDADKRTQMSQAAQNLRIPYWDWAARPEDPTQHVFPESIGQAEIDIDGPYGVQRIANPLFAYIFHPLREGEFPDSPFDKCDMTKRTSNQTLGGDSENDLVRDRMDAELPGLQQRLYALFSNYNNYTIFSNAAWRFDSNNNSYDSVESLHDVIHSATGLSGHMAWIWYSAFDPVFFLHHANVDRIFSLWQALNPESWVESYPSTYPTWTGHKGALQNATTLLTPFFRYDGLPMTSDDVRDTNPLGYIYPELLLLGPTWNGFNATGNSSRSILIQKLTDLYGSSGPSQLNTSHAIDPLHRDSVRPQQRSQMYKSQRPPNSPGICWDAHFSKHPPVDSVVVDGEYREWVINVHVNRHALQSSFRIPFFLGDPILPAASSSFSSEPNWSLSPKLVGTASIFSGRGDKGSNNQVSTTVPLTSALMQMIVEGHLVSLAPKAVEPLLRTKLGYKVVTAGGEEVESAEVEGLRITVASARVRAMGVGEFPVWGDMGVVFGLY